MLAGLTRAAAPWGVAGATGTGRNGQQRRGGSGPPTEPQQRQAAGPPAAVGNVMASQAGNANKVAPHQVYERHAAPAEGFAPDLMQ